jgi:hypothetical protein
LKMIRDGEVGKACSSCKEASLTNEAKRIPPAPRR